GTPLYVFNLDEMAENVSVLKKNLGGKADLCFAMKANPFLVRPLAAITDRVEVCSMGEFRICKEQRIPPEKILISGVLKKREDLYEILRCCRGKCAYTVESMNQFHALVQWCDVSGEALHIYLRLSSGNQFGMDEETLQNIISLRHMWPLIKIRGIHYFSGTQKKSMEKVKKELAYLDWFCASLEEKFEFQTEELEYGPGVSIPYFKGQENTLEKDIRAIAAAVSTMKWKGRMTLEMGRALTASCGYYLTSVRDTKQNKEKNYCIVDGGIHQIHYDGQIRGMYCPLFRISPEQEAGPKQEWTICGSLCTANDVLIQKVEIKNLEIGDVLIFEHAGAYAMTEGMALFLSHELPGIACYSRKMGWKLVRKEQCTYNWNMEEETKDGDFKEYFNGN
ncbi:MAG: hypothetical protein HFI37_03590, partial [Lachnospiraceae bacterium]|nr:hypothetical protein [Lachnospiraceae bacterium]